MRLPMGLQGAFVDGTMDSHLFKGDWSWDEVQRTACGEIAESLSYYEQEITCAQCVQVAVRQWESK